MQTAYTGNTRHLPLRPWVWVVPALVAGAALPLMWSIPGAAVGRPAAAGASTAAPVAGSFEKEVRPLLAKYCFTCHGPTKKSAKVDLSIFPTEASPAGKQDVWLAAVRQLKLSVMPPERSPQPSEAERRLLIERLDAAMEQIDLTLPVNPGRVPPRRLNRIEYNNTIRDLIGLDLRPADEFPPDDVAHGFDNVAEGLTLSPLLLDKYLDAAERILERAILPSDVRPTALTLEAESLERARKSGGNAELSLEQELGTTVSFPAADEYEIRVRAHQTGGGADGATLVLKLDGVDTKVWTVTAPPDKPAVYEAALPVRAGTHRLSIRHTWHTAAVVKDKKLPDVRVLVDRIEVAGPRRAAAHRHIFVVEPGGGLSERDAARKVIESFAGRAFRRPATPGEVERMAALYEKGRAAGKPHVEALRPVLASVLVSPHFLFRLEIDRSSRDEHGAYRLSDWELASRLSYFLWSSMPDAELFDLARSRRLHDPAVLRAQVKRMLADPKATALFENFGGQWLGLRKLETHTPDKGLFPSFNETLRQAMIAEPLMLLEHIARENRSLAELINADYTFLNEDLARHYGVRGVQGPHMRKVSLSDGERGGVLTSAAVLTATSYPTRTSAVRRGKWILEEVLGAPPPPPPPDVPELPEPPRGQAVDHPTLRERLERHRSDPACFSCHKTMDVLGLGMENFDAVGRRRDKDGGRKIDATGTLPDGGTFNGPAELKRLLAARRQEFARTLTEKMFVYALGRGPERFDRREVKRITEELGRNDYRFATLVSEIVVSYPFRYRMENKS